MATLSELVDTIARVEGIDSATVTLIARSVREAGLITTGGRGLSAAQMTYRDAANLVIAVNASPTAREAEETVHTYRALEGRSLEFAFKGSKKPKLGNFGDALETLIAAAAIGKLPDVYLGIPLDKLILEEFASSHIKIELTFHKPLPFVSLAFATPRLKEPFDLSRITSFRHIGPSRTFDFELPKKVRLWASRNFGDKQERTSIGYPTIREVGELFRLEQRLDRGAADRA
jgi:hypothetical protein